jgi:hypothetical protein
MPALGFQFNPDEKLVVFMLLKHSDSCFTVCMTDFYVLCLGSVTQQIFMEIQQYARWQIFLVFLFIFLTQKNNICSVKTYTKEQLK